jgi:hypothetical protein
MIVFLWLRVAQPFPNCRALFRAFCHCHRDLEIQQCLLYMDTGITCIWLNTASFIFCADRARLRIPRQARPP